MITPEYPDFNNQDPNLGPGFAGDPNHEASIQGWDDLEDPAAADISPTVPGLDQEALCDQAHEALLQVISLKLTGVPFGTRDYGIGQAADAEEYQIGQGDSIRHTYLYDPNPKAPQLAILDQGLNDTRGFYTLIGATSYSGSTESTKDSTEKPALANGVRVDFNADSLAYTSTLETAVDVEAVKTAVQRAVFIDVGLFFSAVKLFNGEFAGRKNKKVRGLVEQALEQAVVAYRAKHSD